MKTSSLIDIEAVLPFPELPRVPVGQLMQTLWLLLLFDWIARFKNFPGVYRWVDSTPIGRQKVTSSAAIEQTSAAINLACSLYPKTAACLQRSAVMALMLRRRGVPAQMVIGVQRFPFRSHAWIEAGGVVLNERPTVREMYMEIDRCGHLGESAKR